MPEMFRLAHSVRMSASAPETAEVLLYGEIIENMPDDWKWNADDKSASDFDKSIKGVRESGASKLLLRINSPGGICSEAIAMRTILMTAGFDEINIRIEGMCASAATVIAAIPSAHVEIAEGSEYMIHNPWTIAMGNANEMEGTMKHLRSLEKTFRNMYAKKSGQEDSQIKDWMDAETWFTAEEAVEYGFADEVLADENAAPIAACVSPSMYAAMNAMYKAVPKAVTVEDTAEATEPKEDQAKNTDNEKLSDKTTDDSNGAPVAGEPTVNKSMEDENMELKDLTMEQLRDGNPDLFAQVQQSAITAERERIDTIDVLTLAGYEEMAAAAKANGTSALDFQKEVVAAQKQKGAEFIANRVQETAPAAEVAGAEPTASVDEEQEIKNAAADMAKYAEGYRANSNGMF